MQPPIPPIPTPSRTHQPALATGERLTALGAPQTRRSNTPPHLMLRMLGTPLPRPLHTTLHHECQPLFNLKFGLNDENGKN
jgi:hypothetical protein